MTYYTDIESSDYAESFILCSFNAVNEYESQPPENEFEKKLLERYSSEQLKQKFAWNVRDNKPVSVKTIHGNAVLIRI
jgi:hypothetical protein